MIPSACKMTESIPEIFNEIADVTTFHGNYSSDIVVVNTQGGPHTELNDSWVKGYMKSTKTNNALYANVHQVQTKNPSQFSTEDITFEAAKEFDKESVANLKKVVNFFKAQNKTIYVLGISFGAFVTQRLIAEHGIDVADGYLIMAGRLNLEEENVQLSSEGKYQHYLYDDNGNSTFDYFGVAPNANHRNMARLAAGLSFNRYIEELGDIDNLSKITYVYGDRDDRVGALSVQEIQFLKDREARVILSENGNHSAVTEKGLSVLKETFGIK